MSSSTTQVYEVPSWAMQKWHEASSSWQTCGPWNVSYDMQLYRMLDYEKYTRKYEFMYPFPVLLRLICTDGTIIPADLFHE